MKKTIPFNIPKHLETAFENFIELAVQLIDVDLNDCSDHEREIIEFMERWLQEQEEKREKNDAKL